MDLFTVLLIGLAAWLSILLVVIAMCRAAARADGNLELGNRRSERGSSAPTGTEAPAPTAVLIGHR